jgi:hypothetical protein
MMRTETDDIRTWLEELEDERIHESKEGSF